MIIYKSPKPLQIQRLRAKIQKELNMNINQARVWCGSAALADPSLWLGWETGDYQMPAATWQLVQVKVLLFDADLFKINIDLPGMRYSAGLPVFKDFLTNRPYKRLTMKDQVTAAQKNRKKPTSG